VQDRSSQISTTRIPVADARESEPETTRLAAPRTTPPDTPPPQQRSTTPADTPPTQQRSSTPAPSQPAEREIESWLSDLRAAPAPGAGLTDSARPPAARPKPSAEETRAMPAGNNHAASHERPDDGDTSALPTPPRDGGDAATATEKLNTSGGDGGVEKPRQRRGGGLSAQDLLRREGRF
jgi:trehalose monomycolate/heme transporter